MRLKTISRCASTLILSCALGACYPGPEKVGELAKTSIQQRLRDDPQFAGTGIEVVSVRVTGGGKKQFDAIANVSHAGRMHAVPVTVVVDGINLQWFAEPNAFAFAARSKPADRQQTPR